MRGWDLLIVLSQIFGIGTSYVSTYVGNQNRISEKNSLSAYSYILYEFFVHSHLKFKMLWWAQHIHTRTVVVPHNTTNIVVLPLQQSSTACFCQAWQVLSVFARWKVTAFCPLKHLLFPLSSIWTTTGLIKVRMELPTTYLVWEEGEHPILWCFLYPKVFWVWRLWGQRDTSSSSFFCTIVNLK